MKKKLLSGAAIGLSFAGIASLIVRFIGFNANSLTVFLYLYVILGVFYPLKNHVIDTSSLPDILHRIVIVAEGEELKMRKLVTGEKYRIDGNVEKL